MTAPSGNWFSVTRDVFSDPLLAGIYDRRSAWLWLVANAAYRDHEISISRGVMVLLKRGQVVAGRDHLAKVWGWKPKKVRTFLDALRSRGRLEKGQRNGQYANILTICNYEEMQSASKPRDASEGHRKGQRRANEGPHSNKGTRETISSSGRDLLTDALAAFNEAAKAQGFSKCIDTAARRQRLQSRLQDIGGGDLAAGLERFREALAAIPHDPFLSGRIPGKSFKLSLDRLLSTKSGMGDVLARLVDLHNEHGPAVPHRPAGDVRRENMRLACAEYRTGGTWPEKFGPAPGQHGCQVPADILAEFGLAKPPAAPKTAPDNVIPLRVPENVDARAVNLASQRDLPLGGLHDSQKTSAAL